MDLLSESSSGSRVLIARHISADKTLPESNHEINSTLLCHSYSSNPDFASYYRALYPYIWALWGCGLGMVLMVYVMYFLSIRAALKHWRDFISYVAVVLIVYPVVATCAFISIIEPRFRLPAEAISQQCVTIALYQFFRLVIAECGGVDQLIRSSGGANLETRVLPCCCWPCCILPRPKVGKKSLTWLNCMVLQMPVVQAILYIIIVAIWAEDYDLYMSKFVFFQPFVAASILPAMWGVVMCVKAAISIGHNPRPRFFAIQLVLIIVKLQVGLTKSLPNISNKTCFGNVHPAVFSGLIQNLIMLVEMLLLSVWALCLYTRPPGKVMNNETSKKTITIEENLRSIEVRSAKEGIDNKSFNNNVIVDN